MSGRANDRRQLLKGRMSIYACMEPPLGVWLNIIGYLMARCLFAPTHETWLGKLCLMYSTVHLPGAMDTIYQPCLRILLTLLHSAMKPSWNNRRHRSIRRFFFS